MHCFDLCGNFVAFQYNRFIMKVAIIMGSKSDLEVMQQAAQVLSDFQIEHHIQIVSAHRTPELMVQFAKEAYEKDYRVIIAGAGSSPSSGYGCITNCTSCNWCSCKIEQ